MEEFQPGDEEEIVKLLELVFNGWPHFDLLCTPLDHWKWKHLDNPLSRRMIIKAVSKNDHKIIGCNHGLDLNVKIGDDMYYVNNGVDLAVHPDYRRMGVYRNMLEKRIKMRNNAGDKLNFWSSNNPIITKNISNPDSFEFPKIISSYVRIRNIELHFKMAPTDKAWIKKRGYQILNLINKSSNLFKPGFTSDKKVKIKNISKFDKRINPFWDQISKEYSFIVKRHQSNLNWRYCDPRGGNYHVYVAEEEDSIIGYIIVRINKYREDYHTGYIVDLLTLPNRNDASEALIEKAIEFFDNNNVNIVDCLAVRNSQLARNLQRWGFLDSRKKLFVIVSPHEMNKQEIENISSNISMKKEHLVYGDFDGI